MSGHSNCARGTNGAALEPDREAMAAHLHLLADPLLASHPDAMIEIAWDHGGDGSIASASVWPLTELDKAVEEALIRNRSGHNVYVGAFIKKPGTARDRRTNGGDFLAATALPTDCDKGAAAVLARLTALAKPGATVTTGTIPEPRQQVWIKVNPFLDRETTAVAFARCVDAVGGDRRP